MAGAPRCRVRQRQQLVGARGDEAAASAETWAATPLSDEEGLDGLDGADPADLDTEIRP